MRIFLDTSLLNDARLSRIAKEIAEQNLLGDEFYLSAITHFQLMWSYSIARKSSEKYGAFLRSVRVEIAPLTKVDAEVAAQMKPSKTDLLDSLIAACVKRYDATVWTADRDFLKFLSKDKVRLLSE